MMIIKKIKYYMVRYKIIENILRFSPEPSGELHLGHLKCINLNLLILNKFGGKFILRFDDTNPNSSKKKFVYKINEFFMLINIKYKVSFTSNYFELLYILAKLFIKNNLAYVEYKNFKLNIEFSLKVFKLMKNGILKPGTAVLKSKISTVSKNYSLKSSIMYRILNKKHFNSNFFIFPTYNFSHCIIDCIEGVTFSICSKDFENNIFFYNWYKEKYYYCIGNFNRKFPMQIEFSKLRIENVNLSKRYLKKIKYINLNLMCLINRGFYLSDLFNFLNNLSYSKEQGVVKIDFFIRYFVKNLKCNHKIYIFRKLFIVEYNKQSYYINLTKKKNMFFFKLKENVKKIIIVFSNIFSNIKFKLGFFVDRVVYNSINNRDRVFVFNYGIFIKNKNILNELLSIR
ncbi:glutamate--tRNA ligase family protein [Candidatus Vidania fulgoroideorum]